MSGFENAKGNANYLKKRMTQQFQAGERLLGSEFIFSFEGNEALSVLVRTAQMPAMARREVEDQGQGGVTITQYGPIENSGEITIGCAETITGPVLKYLRDVIKNKKYIDCAMQHAPESTEGAAEDHQKVRMMHCMLRSDAIDFSTEDNTAVVRPSITIRYNWLDI